MDKLNIDSRDIFHVLIGHCRAELKYEYSYIKEMIRDYK